MVIFKRRRDGAIANAANRYVINGDRAIFSFGIDSIMEKTARQLVQGFVVVAAFGAASGNDRF